MVEKIKKNIKMKKLKKPIKREKKKLKKLDDFKNQNLRVQKWIGKLTTIF